MSVPAPIEIINYSDELKDHIRILNYEWLEKFFRIEKRDEITLSNPKREIIENGGYIFYAKWNSEIVGTVSLVYMSEAVFELSKMAVTEKAKGIGIGNALLEHCLAFAKEKNIERLILYSNSKLKAALHLYEKYGFTKIELEKGVYERADVKMEKRIFIQP